MILYWLLLAFWWRTIILRGDVFKPIITPWGSLRMTKALFQGSMRSAGHIALAAVYGTWWVVYFYRWRGCLLWHGSDDNENAFYSLLLGEYCGTTISYCFSRDILTSPKIGQRIRPVTIRYSGYGVSFMLHAFTTPDDNSPFCTIL